MYRPIWLAVSGKARGHGRTFSIEGPPKPLYPEADPYGAEPEPEPVLAPETLPAMDTSNPFAMWQLMLSASEKSVAAQHERERLFYESVIARDRQFYEQTSKKQDRDGPIVDAINKMGHALTALTRTQAEISSRIEALEEDEGPRQADLAPRTVSEQFLSKLTPLLERFGEQKLMDLMSGPAVASVMKGSAS